MPEPLIQVQDLVQTHVIEVQEVHALRRVSLTIERGEFVAIMGHPARANLLL